MTHLIGETAGRIWELLRKKRKINIELLPKNLKEKDIIVYQALGWLAREDKIEYHEQRKKIYITLSSVE